MFIVAWIEDDIKNWEMIDGLDATHQFIFELTESGIDESDIVFGQMEE